jgi:DNA helicase-2/ATP-dependent DNA helicase PcrA
VFYRTNSQSRLLEEHLRKENIPYTIFGAVEFYDRLEIKDIVAYLRVMVNDQDEVSLRRIINTPTRGLGDKAVEQVEAYAKEHKLTMWQAIYHMAQHNYPRLGPKLCYFYDMITALKTAINNGPLDKAIQEVLDATDYLEHLNKKFPDQARDKTENIYELAFAMAEFSKRHPEATLGDWLQSITLVRDESDPMAATGVSLMTLHMAKGLEFPRVYIAGVEEGLIPHRNNMDGYLLEEERRLFYVGMTRAKERLSLVCAQRRQFFNNYMAGTPSRFVKEIPQQLLKPYFEPLHGGAHNIYDDYDPLGTESHSGEMSYDFDDDREERNSPIEKGSMVFHPTFGKGVVETIEREFGKMKCTVTFDEFGQRKVNLTQLSAVSQRVKDVFF